MKKSLKAALAFALALVIIPTSISAPAQAVDRTVACSEGGFFTIVGTRITNSSAACAGQVSIPADVVEVGGEAFQNRTLVTSLVFEPNSQIKILGVFAFHNTRITEVDLPDGLQKIAYWAFAETRLTTLSVPGTVDGFDDDMFRSSLFTSLIFERRIATTLRLGAVVFNNSPNASVTFIGPVVVGPYNWNDTIPQVAGYRTRGWSASPSGPIVTFPLTVQEPGVTLYQVRAPDVITTYPCSVAGTFRTKNDNLEQSSSDCAGEVVVPANITDINGSVFSGRTGITSVIFEAGSNLKTIHGGAFQNTRITSIDLPDGLVTVGGSAFKETRLTSISIPGTVTSVGGEAFSAPSIETLIFETRTENGLGFDINSLRDSSNLTSVTWTGGRTHNWGNVSILKLDHTWLGWSTSVGGALVANPFALPTTGITLYPNWKPDILTTFTCSSGGTFLTRNLILEKSSSDCAGEITIPAFVETIATASFEDRAITGVQFEVDSKLKEINSHAFQNTQFSSIDLPDGLQSIRYGAFSRSKLTSISIPGTVTYLQNDSFLASHRLTTVVFERRIAATLNTESSSLARLGRLQSVRYEGPISLSSALNAGRGGSDFVGWSTSVGGPVATFPLTAGEEGVTIYPNYINPRTYNLILNPTGGTLLGTGSVVGGEIIFPEVTRAGYTLRGWSDPGYNPYYRPVEFWEEARDLSLMAFWNPNTNDLNFDSRGGTPVSSSTFLTDSRIDTAPEEPTREGYTFAGWSETERGDVVRFPYSPSAKDDLTLFAQWAPNRHDVNFDSKGGSFREPISFFTDGQIEESPSAPDRPGYTLAGWAATDNGSVLSFPYSPGVIGAITLYAVWTANTYVVTFDSKGGSSVPSTTYVTDGQMTSPVQEPNLLGYSFEGWSATDGGTAISLPYTPGVIGDITLHALWVKKFVATYVSNGGSEVEVGYFKNLGTVDSSPTAPTRRGYTFAGWSATNGGTAISFPYAPGVSEDINLYALWTVNIYTITFNANGGVAVPNGSFTIETDAQLVTPIRVGYTFNGWSATDGGAIVAFPYAPGVVENITLYAKWTRNPYKPELLSNPTVSGTGFQSTYMAANLGSWSAYPDAVLTLQWYRCDKAVSVGLSTIPASLKCVKIAGATKTKYKLVEADAGEYMTVLVQAKNSIGTTFVTAKSDRALALKAPVKVKLPAVTGTAVAKQTLTVDDGTFSANPVAKISIQWFRCEDDTKVSSLPVPESAECEAIKGAKGTRYKLVMADEGKYITAQIEAENSEGTAFTTAKSTRVALTPSVTSNPGISGSSLIGKVLSAGSGSWLAFPAAETSVQWFRCNKQTSAGAKSFGGSSGCAAIRGANKTRYTVAAADRGKHIAALITAENKAGDATVTTDSEQVAYEPVRTGSPSISGSAVLGRTLNASPGSWNAFPEEQTSFKWFRCSSPTQPGSESFARASGCVAIGGANDSSYTVSEADEGKYLSVLVKAANSAGSSTVTARSTAKVG